MRRAWSFVAAGVLLVAAARPAAADWLLMLDGSQLETKGAWEVKGSQVVFKLPNGTLATVRADAVDFEGSARITQEANAPRLPPPPSPPRKAAVRLTDADVGHGELPAPAAAGEITAAAAGQTGATAGAATPAPTSPSTTLGDLEVVDWSARYDVETAKTVLKGTVRNNGELLAHKLKVVVTTLDGEGHELAKTDAELSAAGVMPKGTVPFEVAYPGIVEIKGAKFEMTAEHVALRPISAKPAPTPTPSTTLVPVGSPSTARLRIASWRADPEAQPGSTSIIGELVNESSEIAYDSALDVTLRGADGKDLATAQALLGLRNLQPGEKTNFRVTFPGVESYSDIAFRARHTSRRQVTRTVPVRPGNSR